MTHFSHGFWTFRRKNLMNFFLYRFFNRPETRIGRIDFLRREFFGIEKIEINNWRRKSKNAFFYIYKKTEM